LQDIFTLFLFLLGFVGIIYLGFVFSKRLSKGVLKINSSKHMNVIDRLVVGQDRYILIVSVLDKYYLISVTGQSIEILKELDGEELETDPEPPQRIVDFEAFKSVFQNAFKKTKK